MKMSARDIPALSTVRPLEVAAYLRANGWKKCAEGAGQWAAWELRNDQGEQFEIALPLSHTLLDFAQRIADALTILEVVEDRDQFEILRDLLITGADLIRVRLTDSELRDGSVPIEDGTQFVQRARDMMLAAACSARVPKAYFPGRKPNEAVDYMRKVRLGQTERGSFVLTIISRVSPSLNREKNQLFETDEPFERKVTHTLANALFAVKEAAEDAASTGTVESFVSSIQSGVSANLCDAIVGMAASPETSRDVEIAFTWSRSRPLLEAAPARDHVLVTRDAIPIIEEASRYFKETSPREGFDLWGQVVKLERAENATTGRVTVICLIDDRARKVSFELSGRDYEDALRAHKDRQMVRCSGLLSRVGRAFELRDVCDFTIESDDDNC